MNKLIIVQAIKLVMGITVFLMLASFTIQYAPKEYVMSAVRFGMVFIISGGAEYALARVRLKSWDWIFIAFVLSLSMVFASFQLLFLLKPALILTVAFAALPIIINRD